MLVAPLLCVGAGVTVTPPMYAEAKRSQAGPIRRVGRPAAVIHKLWFANSLASREGLRLFVCFFCISYSVYLRVSTKNA
jgi:hypothetical protein